MLRWVAETMPSAARCDNVQKICEDAKVASGTARQGLRASVAAHWVGKLALGAGIALSGGALFFIDITSPRGVLDGVGYSAVVALTSGFGKRALIASATLTTVLTLLGAALVPDTGISVGGMWANRVFAIASIWVVALLMQSRMGLERRIKNREASLHRHKAALANMVREGLLTDVSLDQRLEFICRTGAQALDCSFAIIAMRNEGNHTATVMQAWHKTPQPNLPVSGTNVTADPLHRERLQREFTVAITDVEQASLAAEGRRVTRAFGVRATLSAEIFQGGPKSGTLVFAKEVPYRWDEEEIAFARAVANLVALLLSAQKNADTLAALELTDDGIYTEDAEGTVQYANRAARLLAENGEGGPSFPKPGAPFQGDQDQHSIRFGQRDLEIHRNRLPAGGLIARLIDVTDRNVAEGEKLRLENRLQQAAKMEAIGQLAGGIAHDFNNILGAITVFAGFIVQDTAMDSENREFAQRILSAANRGKDMVDQIMSFAETRAVSQGQADLHRILEHCRELLTPSMCSGAVLETGLPPIALQVRGSEVQLGQMVNNLILNARDALGGREGKVVIEARSAPQEEIEAFGNFSNTPLERLVGEPVAGQRYARLSVRDSGSGIEPGIMDRIFEPFFSTKGRQRGTGLGLAVVHGVIRSHGGFCHLRSVRGEGTAFNIYLPLADETMVSATTTPNGGGLGRVLIVDDEADMADTLSIGLERLGYATVAVQDPLTALVALEEDPYAFDTLVTDLQMPMMSGMELIRKARDAAPHLRTILCTGNAAGVTEAEILSHGADAIFYKPIEIQLVANALCRRSDAVSQTADHAENS
jgi:signal transduction histidine kinase/ActR/RegA family two-component response regulator